MHYPWVECASGGFPGCLYALVVKVSHALNSALGIKIPASPLRCEGALRPPVSDLRICTNYRRIRSHGRNGWPRRRVDGAVVA